MAARKARLAAIAEATAPLVEQRDQLHGDIYDKAEELRAIVAEAEAKREELTQEINALNAIADGIEECWISGDELPGRLAIFKHIK